MGLAIRLTRRTLLLSAVVGALGMVKPRLAAAEGARFFSETGHSVGGAFLAFFDAHGGLDIFGYPRTEEFVEHGRTVQYFQRARMEWWPENGPAFQVQLGLLATELGKGEPPLPSAPGDPAVRYFPESGHTLGGAFRDFWESRGGLEIFGYPVTEERDEGGLRVQYCQRARLEWHPKNPPAQQVQLGLLGDELIFGRGRVDLTRTRPVPAQTGPVAAPVSESTRGRIVFQEVTGGPIDVMNADGSNLHQIGQGIDPAWSPDGTRVAFARWDYPPGIYIMNADGSEVGRWWDVNEAQGLSWSPDGSKVVFYSKYLGRIIAFNPAVRRRGWVPDDQWKLTILDLSTHQAEDLPRELHAFTPSWSPDSKTLVYKGDRGLYTTSLGGQSQLIPNTDTRFASPAWSPNGDQIAFMWRQHDHWEIGVIGPDGNGFKLLTSFKPFTRAANNVAPTWSPDGQEIAFLSDREGDWKIYVMSADGSNQRKLSDAPVEYEYAFERVLSWVK